MGEAERLATVIKELRARLDRHDEGREKVQKELEAICTSMQEEITKMEDDINNQLQKAFCNEDERLQSILHTLECELAKGVSDKETLDKLVSAANAELLVELNYSLVTEKEEQKGLCRKYRLNVDKTVNWGYASITTKKPEDITLVGFEKGKLSLRFETPFSDREEEIIKEAGCEDCVNYNVVLCDVLNDKVCTSTILGYKERSFATTGLMAETGYWTKVRTEIKCKKSAWSDPVR